MIRQVIKYVECIVRKRFKEVLSLNCSKCKHV